MRSLRWMVPLALSALGCGGAEVGVRRDLARGFEPGAVLDGALDWGEGLRLAPSDRSSEPWGLWIGATLPPEAWSPLTDGLWSAPRAVGNVALLLSAETPERLRTPAGELERVRLEDGAPDLDAIRPGSFALVLDRVYLALEPGQSPPEGLTLESLVSRGFERDGSWRVELGRWAADGVPVWSGTSEYLELTAKPGAELSFATAAIAPAAPALDLARARGRVTFRLSLEGRELFRHEQEVTGAGTLERHRVSLPEGLRSGTLELAVEGDPAIAAFLNPTAIPRELAEDPRPNVLLFLADTFRADNLTAYGGRHQLTPALDALIERSLLFERAWTTAVWTLPSQASMLTGHLPFQHTATRPGQRIPAEAVTIAETLRAAGYRTAAVTDAGLVSRRHAFDQGFEFFDELFRDDFSATHESVMSLLDADDGRPLFLYVQTYRVHRPYRVSEQTRAEHGERLGIAGQFDPTFEELEAAGWKSGDSPLPQNLADTARRLEALYRGGVIDFDRDFASFVDELERRGFFSPGRMLFTSDHGEAFGEHGALWHHVGVWEPIARIPMFAYGTDIEPGRVSHAASLLDAPRTLSALAGVEADPDWGGAALTELDRDRPALTFQCPPQLPGQMGIVDGSLKAHLEASTAAVDDGRLDGVFDLDRDPTELNPAAADTARGAELLKTWSAIAREALEPAFSRDLAPLGRADEERLRALGYLEDGE
jgi:arylsulfatase A-like enzyme